MNGGIQYKGPSKYNLTGLRFGRLLVMEYMGSDENQQRIWRCWCDCGDYRNVLARLLLATRKSRKVDSCIKCKWGRQIPVLIGEDGVVEFPLASRKGDSPTTLLDLEDLSLIEEIRWQALRLPSGKWYAISTQSRPMLLMHRVIMNASDGMEVDHINGNRLDNRRRNLRLVNKTQNIWNTKKKKTRVGSRQASQYIGVRRIFRGKGWTKWSAQIVMEKRTYHLGYFGLEKDAAKAYDAAAAKHRGEYAVLNFPEESVLNCSCPHCVAQCEKHGR